MSEKLENLELARRFWSNNSWKNFIKDQLEITDEELDKLIKYYRENNLK